jgi:flagellar hook-associated protein 1 FlgK
VADSDSSDVLVALGLNSLLTGSSAADVGVRADIEVDPGLLASSATGSPGDGSLLLELLDVEERDVAGLGGATFGEYYGNLVGEVGFGIGATHSALLTSDALLASLEARRDQVSGVSVDEEVASMLQYEQAFAAAAQYITVVNQLDEELLTLI